MTHFFLDLLFLSVLYYLRDPCAPVTYIIIIVCICICWVYVYIFVSHHFSFNTLARTLFICILFTFILCFFFLFYILEISYVCDGDELTLQRIVLFASSRFFCLLLYMREYEFLLHDCTIFTLCMCMFRGGTSVKGVDFRFFIILFVFGMMASFGRRTIYSIVCQTFLCWNDFVYTHTHTSYNKKCYVTLCMKICRLGIYV